MPKNKTVFVTGANGFVGRVTVAKLAENIRVIALLRSGSLPGFAITKNVKIVWGDITDLDRLKKVIPKGSVIVNLAANPYNPQLAEKVNVRGTSNLLEAARLKGCPRFIQISSQATKIRVKGIYARTKDAADQLVRESGLTYTILKPSLIYGPGERGLFAKLNKLMRLLPFVPVFGSGNTLVYPVSVECVANTISKITMDTSKNSGEWDLGSKPGISYNELYRIIAHPNQPRLLHIPAKIGLTIAKLIRWMPNPPISEDNILGSTQTIKCNSAPIKKYYQIEIAGLRHDWKNDGNKIKVAVVGLGKMGTFHMAILSALSQVQIVALVDTNPALFQTVKSMGITGDYYASLNEAINKTALDAVFILTPTFTHLTLLKEALEAGLHVFIEKPVAMNQKELLQLKKLHPNKVVRTGYTLLSSPVWQFVAELLKSGKYGKVIKATLQFEHGEVFGPKKGWMFNPKLSGGGVLMNPGPHVFSIIHLLFGSPTSVNAKLEDLYTKGVEDKVKAVLSYHNFDVIANLSWSVPNKHISETKLVVYLNKGTITCDGQKIVIKSLDKKVVIKSSDLADHTALNLNPKAYGDAYYREDIEFIQAIEGHRTPSFNTLDSAINIENVIHQIYKKGQR